MLITLKWSNAQFPQDVYMAEDREVITDLLAKYHLEETPIEDATETRVTLEELMPYPCDDLPNRQKHYLRDFGQVANNVRTYTEVLTTQGRYYDLPSDYDAQCSCPPIYQVLWNPVRGKHRNFSAQLRQGYVPQETTQIMVEKQQMYVIFFENHNVVEYRSSNIMNVVGTEDPRIANQAASNFRRRFLHDVRNHRRIRPVEYKAIAQTNLQSTVKRAFFNRTNDDGYITSYRYLLVTDLDVMTQLRMIDHLITILYETYEWVDWKVTAVDASAVDQTWLSINRQEPCQFAEDASWGLDYAQGVHATLRVCDFHEYSYTSNASENGFEVLFPIGNFEPAELSQDSRYELRKLNSTITWRFVEGDISQSALLKVIFEHGNTRTRPTALYSLVSNDRHVRFHRNFLMSPWWKIARTQLMIHAQDQMCERTEYVKFVRQLRENNRPRTRIEQYRVLQRMNRRFPENCQKIYRNDNACRKYRRSGECYYGVGSSTTAYLRTNLRVDPWQNEAEIPQGEICFLANTTRSQIAKESVTSTAVEMIGIKIKPELKYEAKTRLKTFRQIVAEKWRNKADNMNHALAVFEQSMVDIRSIGMTGSHEENLLARYAARRAVTRSGETPIDWNKKFNETRQNLNAAFARFRELELRLSNLGEETQRAIVSYYLSQQIQAMLPHLEITKANELTVGKIFRISLKKGELIVKTIAEYKRPQITVATSTAQSTDAVITEASKETTMPDDTTQGATHYETKESTGGTTKRSSTVATTTSMSETKKAKTMRLKVLTKLQKGDENHAIMKLLEDELTGHKVNNETWQQIMKMIENRITPHTMNSLDLRVTKYQVKEIDEHTIFILIIVGTTLGTILILGLIYALLDRKRKDKLISLKKAELMTNKTKSLPFTEKR